MTRVQRFKHLLGRLKAVEPQLRSLDHAHHVDVGFRYVDGVRTNALAVRIFIHGPKHSRAKSRNLAPKRICGLATDVISSSSNRHCMSDPDPARVAVADPLVGGISISSSGGGAGTMGLVVRSSLFPGPLILTCNHVADAHERVYQPAQADSPSARLVGETCVVSNQYLASLVRILAAPAEVGAVVGLPRITGAISRDALIEQCAQHAIVKKSGRSTAVTVGELDGVSPSGSVSIVNLADSPQPEVACEGDSGAVWSTEQGEAVALHYAGQPWRAFAQAMAPIARSFGLIFTP